MQFLSITIQSSILYILGGISLFAITTASGYLIKKYIDMLFEKAKEKEVAFDSLISKVDELVTKVAGIIKDLNIYEGQLIAHAEIDEEFRSNFEKQINYRLQGLSGQILQGETVNKARHESLKGKMKSFASNQDKYSDKLHEIERRVDAIHNAHNHIHPNTKIDV